LRAAKVTMARGQNAADVELKAAPTAPPGDKTDVRAAGTAAGLSGVNSPNFTLTIKALPSFDLKVETNPVTVHQAGRARLRITAVRKDYAGPIAVEAHRLPAHISATKAIIPAGQNAVEIEIAADVKAAVADHGDVVVHGVGEGHQTDSPPFRLSVRKK
jgi:hypothetical protein